MKKLIKGIVDFRQRVLPYNKEKFAKLALGQSPDTLFIACSDSRVAANVFASTNPGDLFVVRNVGNMIPNTDNEGYSTADESEAAAIEFAVLNLKVTDIIICGHSECGGMHALINGRSKVAAPHLRSWLRHGEDSLAQLRKAKARKSAGSKAGKLSPVNKLSQLNVLQQIEHLRSYPVVKERIAKGKLRLHGWWFELSTAGVYAYEKKMGKFILIDEKEAARLLKQIS